MESFVNEYISSTLDDDNEINEGLIERRLSPYATLRAGDLAALLRLQTALSPLVKNSFNLSLSRHHDNDNFGCSTTQSSHSLEDDQGLEENDEIGHDFHGNDRRKPQTSDVVCRGADTNDSPAEYTVKGLRQQEMPVMGVCVDKRICPGFQYHVRRAGSDRYVFNAPKTLLSIGMGYGKRITFSGDSLNNNECFFWSDSEPSGYAFSIHAIDIGQRFSIVDASNMVVGEAVVDSIQEPQMELSSVCKDRKVIKRVNVVMNCCMKYYQRHNHGLVEMMVHEDTETVSGVAVLVKSKSSKVATLVSIEEIFIDRFGLCKFELDV